MDINTLFQVLTNGLLISGLYAVLTIGLTLVLGVMGIVNFAHGAFVMIGAYTTYWAFTLLGIDPFISMILSAAVLFLIGIIAFRFTIGPILNDPELNQMLLTLGILIILENIALILWTANTKSVITFYSDKSISLGPIHFGLIRLMVFILSVVLTTALVLFLNKTRIGNSIRAVSQNRDGAWLVGVNVNRIYLVAFGISAALAGIAGTLVSTIMYVEPAVGFRLGLKAFCIVIIGGLGNIYGTLYGSLVLGITESLVGSYLPQGSGWAEGISFMLIMLVLIIKPKGFGGLRRM
ncbi:MAG TPA: branched-chain amino acid ABC transporter permease [Desulfobacteraceae bacterium]|nr:branched-chain amino acid ABC transporter permease [Desulfobacteraceae bacterium]